MGLDNRQTTVTTGLWAVNIASATALIMFNLLTVKSRLAAPATVSALHSLTTAACVALLSSLGAWGESEAPKLPRKHLMAFVLISSISVASANYSLAWNSLGMYQLFKLGLVPLICGMETLLALRRRQTSLAVVLACVLAGLVVYMYQDNALRISGVMVAVIFLCSTSIQQVLCGRLVEMYPLKPHQLLLQTMTLQGGLLLAVGPVLDKWLTGAWVTQWEINVPGLEMLAASCAAAALLNLTQYMILGELFSASCYQAVGTFAKSLTVLVCGAVLFNEHHSISTLGYSGVCIGLAGLAVYGMVALRQPVPLAPNVKAPFGGVASPDHHHHVARNPSHV